MKFLLISQQGIPNPDYSLKDLPGHGRFDIICRVVLAATRNVSERAGDEIYCYLMNKDPNNPSGWIHITPLNHPHDEVSVAYFIKQNWNKLFSVGSLEKLVSSIPNRILLSEEGDNLSTLFADFVIRTDNFDNFDDSDDSDDPDDLDDLDDPDYLDDYIIILGAKEDLTQEDINIIKPTKIISLGNQPMLASQAITYFRLEMDLYLNSVK